VSNNSLPYINENKFSCVVWLTSTSAQNSGKKS